MKKIYNYVKFKITSSKLILLSFILIVYEISLMLYLINKGTPYNIYDFIMKNFSNNSVFYFIFLFFSIMIYNIFDKKNFYNYLSIKFNSRKQIYNGDVLTALLFSIGIVLFINVICLLLGSFMSFNNSWSTYFSESVVGIPLNIDSTKDTITLFIQKLTPLSHLLITNVLVTLYLFFISLSFIVCNILFKKRGISFLMVIILNVLNITFDTGALSKLTFPNNVIILKTRIPELSVGNYIFSRLAYWGILILVIYFLGLILTKKKDCNYGD